MRKDEYKRLIQLAKIALLGSLWLCEARMARSGKPSCPLRPVISIRVLTIGSVNDLKAYSAS